MSSGTAGGGLGLGTVLFVVFLTLKLTDHIDWSWWWVTCPLWAPFGIVAALFVVFAPIMILIKAWDR